MCPLVHGSDAYTALEMVIETTYGTDPGSGYKRIPLLGESTFAKREQFPKNRELGNLGAQATVDFGRGTVEGSFTVYPRYNAIWFNQLLVHAFGGSEELQSGFLPDGTSQAGSYSTHCYTPQSFKETAAGSASAVPPGITFRVWKAGIGSAGIADVWVGCVIKRMTWEHPEGERPRVTFDIIGQIGTQSIVSTLPSAVPAGEIPIRARDLKNRTGLAKSPGILKCGAGLTINPNITAFKVVLESNLEFAPGFLNSPDVIAKPGHVDGWAVSGEIQSLLQQTEFTSGYPAADFLAKLASALRVRYVSDTDLTTSVPYAADLYVKNLVWTKGENGVTEGGAPKTTYAFDAQLATFTTGECALAANQKNTFLLQTVGQSAAYCSAGEGGNETIFPDPDI